MRVKVGRDWTDIGPVRQWTLDGNGRVQTNALLASERHSRHWTAIPAESVNSILPPKGKLK